MRRPLIIALAASAIALAGCASVPFPAPGGENDCLVIIRTRVENPKQMPVVRQYALQLSTGGHEKLMPTSPSSYLAFVISEPFVYFASRHTNIIADGYWGAANDSPMRFALPYKAGFAVIASSEFVNRIEDAGDGRFTNYFEIRPLGADDKAKLIEEINAREGIGAWRMEE